MPRALNGGVGDDGVELLPPPPPSSSSAAHHQPAHAPAAPAAIYGRGEGAKYQIDDALLDGGGGALFASRQRRQCCCGRWPALAVGLAALVGTLLAVLVVVLAVKGGHRHREQAAALAASSTAVTAGKGDDSGQQQQQQQQQRAPARPVADRGCANVRVSTRASAPPPDAAGRRSVVGTVDVLNRNEWPVAVQRVGVRLCSRVSAVGHLRAEALCPSGEVGAKRRMTCMWTLQLPAPGPAPGAELSAWTGLLSSAQLAVSGDRCASPVTDPLTGNAGTCAASADGR